MPQYADRFTEDILTTLFPPERTDRFFEALFGGAEEGSYDIALRYRDDDGDVLHFDLELIQRPGKCLACNLTYGLPGVFARHPVIDLDGLAHAAAGLAGRPLADWRVSNTREIAHGRHAVALDVTLA